MCIWITGVVRAIFVHISCILMPRGIIVTLIVTMYQIYDLLPNERARDFCDASRRAEQICTNKFVICRIGAE